MERRKLMGQSVGGDEPKKRRRAGTNEKDGRDE